MNISELFTTINIVEHSFILRKNHFWNMDVIRTMAVLEEMNNMQKDLWQWVQLFRVHLPRNLPPLLRLCLLQFTRNPVFVVKAAPMLVQSKSDSIILVMQAITVLRLRQNKQRKSLFSTRR